MNYISVTKESFENLQEISENAKQDLQMILQYLKSHDFKIREESSLAFCNHLVMMLDRFQKKELASVDIDEQVIAQLQHKYRKMAEELLKSLYAKYDLPQCLVEEVLLAIYFQTNMEKEEQLCQTNHWS